MWLKYVADSSTFDGVVYGVDLTPEALQAYGYERGLWSQVVSMEVFFVKAPVEIDFETEQDASVISASVNSNKEDMPVVPELVFMPGGTVEPEGIFIVAAKQQKPISIYWNDNGVLESRVVND
jgi:hypothetical protein